MAKIKLEHSRERVFLFFIPGQKIGSTSTGVEE